MSPETGSLGASHAYIDQQPKDHARTKLIKRFDVQRPDSRVQLAANVELPKGVNRRRHYDYRTYIIDKIATVPAEGQQLSCLEGECVPKDALREGHRQSRAHKAHPVIIKERERPDSKTKDITSRKAEGHETCGKR